MNSSARTQQSGTLQNSPPPAQRSQQATDCLLSESSQSASSCSSVTSNEVAEAAAASRTPFLTFTKTSSNKTSSRHELESFANAEETRDSNEDDEQLIEETEQTTSANPFGQKQQDSNNFSIPVSCIEQHQQQQQQQLQLTPNRSKSDQQQFQIGRGGELDAVKQVELFGIGIVALTINGKDRLCLAQISNTLLKEFSYNEIHNRRVALGITCIQCTPIQLEMLRRAGAMPSSSRRCGMITMREAERLCRSFLVEEQPPELPENFYFTVAHRVNYGCRGRFVPARYISSRAKCIECFYCGEFYSPNKFIFHSHRQPNNTECNPPDSPNINSWRKHVDLDWTQEQSQKIRYAWEDVKSLFNGGTRRRAQPNLLSGSTNGGAGADVNPQHLTQPQTQSSASRPVNSSASLVCRKSTTNIGNLQQRKASAADQDGRYPLAANAMHDAGDAEAEDDGEQDHIDVECGEPLSVVVSERNSLLGRFGSREPAKAVKPIKTTQTQHRASPAIGSSNKRPLAGDGSSSLQAHNKRAPLSSSSFHRNQSSISVGTGGGLINMRAPNASQSHLHAGRSIDSQLGGGGIDFSSSPRNLGSRNAAAAAPAASASSNRTIEKVASNLSAHSIGRYACTTSSSNSNPLLIAPDANFIHSQLYSQLMQPQAAQQQLQAHHHQHLQAQGLTADAPMDAQVALRHHIWTSLLANLHCNFAAATSNHQAYGFNQHQAVPSTDANSVSARASIDHIMAPYTQVGAAKLIPNSQSEMSLHNYTTRQ